MTARRPPRRRRRRHQGGFTLVELMVSLVMFSFAIAGVLAVAVSMASGFREQRLGVGTEAAARSVMEFLGDAVRGASPGITSGTIYPMNDPDCLDTAPDVADAFLVTQGSAAPDSLTMTFAYGSVVAQSTTSYSRTGSGSITVTDVSQFAPGDYFVLTDFTNAVLVQIDDVVGSTLTYQAPTCDLSSLPSWDIPAGALVVRALRARFYVGSLDGVPTLFMDPNPAAAATGDEEPLAEGIEDLQIALAVDTDAPANGIDVETTTADTDEWFGNVAGESAPPSNGAVRAVRISLVARAIAPVTGAATFSRPALEDHAAGTADRFRRRVLTSIIEVRNLEGSK